MINTGAKWIQELIQELIQECVCGQLKSVSRGNWGDLGRWHGWSSFSAPYTINPSSLRVNLSINPVSPQPQPLLLLYYQLTHQLLLVTPKGLYIYVSSHQRFKKTKKKRSLYIHLTFSSSTQAPEQFSQYQLPHLRTNISYSNLDPQNQIRRSPRSLSWLSTTISLDHINLSDRSLGPT